MKVILTTEDACKTSRTLELKQTINLPKTSFSMKANLPQNEPKWLAAWAKENLYGQIREARKDAPIFTLHDGPPYANGRIHLGTAINKILKDFIVKMKTLEGFNTPYLPGWDCHGLPIEINVDKELGGTQGPDERPSKCGASAASSRRNLWTFSARTLCAWGFSASGTSLT